MVWDVYLVGQQQVLTSTEYFTKPFMTNNSPSVGVIEKLQLCAMRPQLSEFKHLPLQKIRVLELACCHLISADLIHLSQLIPNMPSLEELDLSGNNFTHQSEFNSLASMLTRPSSLKTVSLQCLKLHFKADTCTLQLSTWTSMHEFLVLNMVERGIHKTLTLKLGPFLGENIDHILKLVADVLQKNTTLQRRVEVASAHDFSQHKGFTLDKRLVWVPART